MSARDWQKASDEFHAHLDECVQCRTNPFGLCPRGGLLLRVAAEGSVDGSHMPHLGVAARTSDRP